MITSRDIRRDLVEWGWHYAIPLLGMIERRAGRDAAFGRAFAQWLTEGGTLLLRDTLAAPFREAPFVSALQGRFFDPWLECWTALDSARLHLRAG